MSESTANKIKRLEALLAVRAEDYKMFGQTSEDMTRDGEIRLELRRLRGEKV